MNIKPVLSIRSILLEGLDIQRTNIKPKENIHSREDGNSNKGMIIKSKIRG